MSSEQRTGASFFSSYDDGALCVRIFSIIFSRFNAQPVELRQGGTSSHLLYSTGHRIFKRSDDPVEVQVIGRSHKKAIHHRRKTIGHCGFYTVSVDSKSRMPDGVIRLR